MKNASYYKDTRKPQIARIKFKGKRLLEYHNTILNYKGLETTRALRMHEGTANLLKHFVNERSQEKIRLRRRIVELENELDLEPLSTQPLAIK
jgi:hypothetical protein